MRSKAQELLYAAQKLAETAETWADLSNSLFSPGTGIVATAFRDRADRDRFIQTEEYKAIQQLIFEAQDRTGLLEGATPRNPSVDFSRAKTTNGSR